MILERQEAGLTDEKSEGRCVCWGFILHNPTGPSKSRVSLPLGAAPDDSLKNTDEISLFPDTLGSPDTLGLKRMSFSQGETFLRMTTMSVGCNHRSVTLESASLWLDLFHKELGRDHLSRFLHIKWLLIWFSRWPFSWGWVQNTFWELYHHHLHHSIYPMTLSTNVYIH